MPRIKKRHKATKGTRKGKHRPSGTSTSTSSSSSSSSSFPFCPDTFFAECHSGVKPLTRWRRSLTGVSLRNPFHYDDCLLCTKVSQKGKEGFPHGTN